MKNKLGLSFSLLLLLAAAAGAQEHGSGGAVRPAGKRVALVIGNDNYGEYGRLNNAVRDASDVGRALTDLGFETTTAKNLTRDEMVRSIREFAGKIGGGVGLFYYAGHGVQIQNKNYLIPVNAKLSSEADAAVEAVGLDFLLALMEESRSRVGIVFLDACRNNPLPLGATRSVVRGLAPAFVTGGMLIVYSTAPGRAAHDGAEGGNSLFAEELLKYIRRPGVEVHKMLQDVRRGVVARSKDQVPWEHSSLLEEFYLNPGRGVRAEAAARGPGAKNDTPAASPAGLDIKDHTWVFRPDDRHIPTFYKFLPGSQVTTHSLHEDSRPSRAGYWYQTGSSVYLIKTRYPGSTLILGRSCKGDIKGDRIEGTCKVTEANRPGEYSENSFPWVLDKVDRVEGPRRGR